MGEANAGPLAVITAGGVSRSQSGEYDKIVCPACEQKFGIGDDHMINFIRGLERGEPRYGWSHHEPLFFEYQSRFARPERIKHFAVSTLVRSHLSDRHFSRAVNIGSHFNRASELVLNRDFGADDEFPVLLFKRAGRFRALSGSPAKKVIDGVEGYIFTLPFISVYVKVDSTPLPSDAQRVQVRRGSNAIVIRLDESTGDDAHVAKLINQNFSSLDCLFGTSKR